MTTADQSNDDTSSAAKARPPVPPSLTPQPPLGTSLPLMPRPKVDHHLLATYDRLLDRYLPASILVSADFEVIHSFGGAEKYLRHRGGRISNGILDLLDDQLRISVGVALHHASQSVQLVRCPDLLFRTAETQVRLAASVQPVPEPQRGNEKFLVLFEEVACDPAREPQGRQLQLEEVTQRYVKNLEAELQATQANLQATIEKLEAANEELQASNEDLAASNEELQNSNEELYTINAENQRRVLELSQATDDLDNLLATTRVGVIFLDEDLRVRRFTPEIARTFRLLPQDLGRSVITFTHNLSYPGLISDLQEVLETRQEKEFEVANTQGKTFLLRMLPYLSGGRLSGVVMALIDIEAIRRAEHELMLRDRAIHAAANGIVIADATVDSLPIIYVNEGFEKITGYSRKSVIGKNCRFLQGPDTDSQEVAAIRSALSQGRGCRATLLNYKKNGQPFWNDLQVAPVLDDSGTVTHFIGVQHDVTDRVNHERALRESEQDYRNTFENAAVGMAHLDVHGRWTRVNTRLCEIVGYNCDELLGMTFHQLTDPEDLGEDVIKYEALISGELTGYCCESRYHHRDGHVVWVLLTTSRRVDGDGRPTGCVAVIQDISRRKEAEIALQKARRMADSANRAKSNFVANMSHELRTPMTAVLGFADMLADELDVAEQLDRVQTIKRNGEYLLRLLDDILDLSKIESRRFKLDPEPCDFMGLIDEVEVLMQGRANQIGNQLLFHFPTQLPKTIYTSSSPVRRIFVNLIANALKFSVHAEVHVTVRYRHDECGEDEELPCIELEVADMSIGRSGEQHARSFMPFTQADPVIVQRFADRGSGLSISKRLVTALGGTIAVASEKDGASTFRVHLPIGEAADLDLVSRASRVSEPPTPPDTSQLRCIEAKILVADDRRDVWQVTKYFLERCGAEVAVAEDGRQAVDAIATAVKDGEPFDLVLLDMQMPIMNGLEAVRELRDAGFSLPIIALTADAMKGERQKCLAAGCDDYLTKPIDVTLLTETVVKHLGEKV